jgi:hypothetical protein
VEAPWWAGERISGPNDGTLGWRGVAAVSGATPAPAHQPRLHSACGLAAAAFFGRLARHTHAERTKPTPRVTGPYPAVWCCYLA